MRKFTGTDFEEPPLVIVSILAIISIIMHLVFPQNALIAKANKNIGYGIIQESSYDIENQFLIDQKDKSESELAKIEGKGGQASKILAEQIESEAETEKIEVKRKKLVTVTAYSSTVDQCDSTPFITASGTHVHDGTIAANFLKFGTKVRFPSLYGDKVFVVEDRMKSNYKVDIWFPTRQEAKNFGVKRVEMEIL